MKTFRLIGRTNIFKCVKEYNALGGTLPCVVGHTLDNKLQTHARVEDIIWLNQGEAK